MTTPMASTMKPERRRRLLEEAAAEFAHAGYERASLNRIIRARGISKSSFYHFFGSKEALFDAVVREAADVLAAELAIPAPAALAGPDFWARIAGLLERLLALAERGGVVDLWRLFYLPDAPATPGSALAGIRARMTAWLDETLAAGRASGAIRDDLPPSLQAALAVAVLQAMDEWTLRHLPELDEAATSRLATAQLAALRRLLAP